MRLLQKNQPSVYFGHVLLASERSGPGTVGPCENHNTSVREGKLWLFLLCCLWINKISQMICTNSSSCALWNNLDLNSNSSVSCFVQESVGERFIWDQSCTRSRPQWSDTAVMHRSKLSQLPPTATGETSLKRGKEISFSGRLKLQIANTIHVKRIHSLLEVYSPETQYFILRMSCNFSRCWSTINKTRGWIKTEKWKQISTKWSEFITIMKYLNFQCTHF